MPFFGILHFHGTRLSRKLLRQQVSYHVQNFRVFFTFLLSISLEDLVGDALSTDALQSCSQSTCYGAFRPVNATVTKSFTVDGFSPVPAVIVGATVVESFNIVSLAVGTFAIFKNFGFHAYAWVAPWFHRTDTNPTVAWNPDHAPKWLFTTTPTWPLPDPAGVAIRYSMYEPGRMGKHEHPYYPLHQCCHTTEHRTQTLTCHDQNSDTAYILHYIYSYLTQGQPEQGLIAMSPQAKHIISKGIGVYATPVLQATTPVAHLTTGLVIYAYLPMSSCRLPQPSLADRLFFTDASGESALTPITGGATLQLIHTRGTLPHGSPHGPHHLRGLLPRGARGHG